MSEVRRVEYGEDEGVLFDFTLAGGNAEMPPSEAICVGEEASSSRAVAYSEDHLD
jgi:hypothetical protein